MIRPEYKAQVDLLLSILPHVATEPLLALKGGTAINLFFQNMPRLSVDIDLTYTRWQDNRSVASQQITEALDRLEARIKKSIPGISVSRIPIGQAEDAKLNCQTRQAAVKIEINTVTRGVFFPTRLMSVTQPVQTEFKKFTAINIVSHAELYGGKICAALDRQHPRDLFDIQYLLKGEGITFDVKLGFLFFLLAHARPVHELLRPHLQDQRHAFENQFKGMTDEPFTYDMFENTRDNLIRLVNDALTERDKQFLVSFVKGDPLWDLIPLPELPNFPAVQWKLLNIKNLKEINPEKHKGMVSLLEFLFQ